MKNKIYKLIALLLVLSLALPASAPAQAAPSVPITFTILHTNDFHGQLEEVLASPGTSSNPGMARVATVANDVRTAVGADKVLLVDAGDEMQGSLLSNLGDGTPAGKGAPTIATYNAMGYNVATFGNHEFDWGQTVLGARTTQATYPYVTANIVKNDTGDCATAGWTKPDFADEPYHISTIGTAPDAVKVALIGVTSAETPTITLASATAGLCFKDAADSIIHYYDEMKTAGADVIVVLSHLGLEDGGYGYGIPVYGDKTLAAKLNTALKPVNLIIGGHSHTNLSPAAVVGTTTVAQAHYNGRKVGRADITVNPSGAVTVVWSRLTVGASNNPPVTAEDPTIKDVINTYATNPDYQALINTEIGYTNVPIVRNYDGDSLMGYFINDALYNDLNADATLTNDVDMFFNNPGGLRADITCASYPCKINYGMTFNVLPFGNLTAVGDMRGDKILELLHQSATLFKGAIQPAGIRYSFYRYTDSVPTAGTVWAWGAFDVTVYNKSNNAWEPLDLNKTYRVGTNEFLAPAGQGGFVPFKYMTNISYWGDMLDGVNRWVSATYTSSNPYNKALDGRILRDGTNAGGSIIPLTILHHNDSHGNLAKGSFVGYTQLATLIKQEKLHNPARTLLLSSGDNIQGDAMSYYFKTAPTGFTSDGTPIADSTLHIQPLIKAFNSMSYDAWVLGNHEFNFGKDVFTSVLGQATFPLLQANVSDDGSYGLATANILPYVEKDLGDIDVAILGIGNHRVPNYELPSNIPGLTFSDPIAKAQELSSLLGPANDVVIGLTHIGFTENPSSVEVDANVDTNLVAQTSGLDAVIGGHSHTNPATGFGNYKYLPSIIPDADGNPVVVAHAYRYNNTLGEVSIGLRPLGGGAYEVVSQTGRYLTVSGTGTAEDADTKAIVDPYAALLTAYNNTVIGNTQAPIDTTMAYIAETNAANLQADAAIFELAKNGITDVDFHLSGAMTRPSSSSNWIMFPTATPATPAQMKISDMFTLMPYENSLVVLNMNGPQLKAVLERAYRNYYYYKYVAGYGGYSYYTTCMLDTNFGNQITYNDLSPALPSGNNVVSLVIGGVPVDFSDASTYYNVSTVNYLAAGSCNFNDGGVTLWPLSQIVADTQYYVRDAVIDYVTAEGTVSPEVEGRLAFITDTTPPVITINTPQAKTYMNLDSLTLDYSAADDIAGVKWINATLDSVAVTNGQVVNLYTFLPGPHTLNVTAMDKAYNEASMSVTFTVDVSIQSTCAVVNRLYDDGKIDNQGIANSLAQKCEQAQKSLDKGKIGTAINQLQAFINEAQAQSGNHITADAAALLVADAQWVIDHLK